MRSPDTSIHGFGVTQFCSQCCETISDLSISFPCEQNNNNNLNELNIPVNSYGQFSCYELLQGNQ